MKHRTISPLPVERPEGYWKDSGDSDVRIVQLLFAPNNGYWQSTLLGLGSDGATYVYDETDGWEKYIDPL